MDATLPYCPSWLGDEAKREWRRVAKHLHQAGILKYVDRTVMAAYCDAAGRFEQLAGLLADEPFTYKTENDYHYPNPKVKQLESAKAEMLRFMRELGLTPSARSRIVVRDGGKAEEVDIIADLFKKAAIG